MPKINPILISERGPGGLRFEQSYETHVLAGGEFQTLVPEDHAPYLRVLKTGGARLDRNKAGAPVLKGSSVREITEALKTYADAMLKAEKSESLLIFFSTTNSVAYAINPGIPGLVFPNGARAAQATKESNAYRWYGRSNPGGSISNGSFAVGTAATVVKKVVHTLPNGRFAVDHERPALPEETFGAKLCEFNTGIWPDRNFWSETNADLPRYTPSKRLGDDGIFDIGGVHFIPYTEEAAEFFYNVTFSLCTLAERMRQFFGQSENELIANINDPHKRKALAPPRRDADVE